MFIRSEILPLVDSNAKKYRAKSGRKNDDGTITIIMEEVDYELT